MASHLETRNGRQVQTYILLSGMCFPGFQLHPCIVLFSASLLSLGTVGLLQCPSCLWAQRCFSGLDTKIFFSPGCGFYGNKTPSKLGDYQVISCHQVSCVSNHIQVFCGHNSQVWFLSFVLIPIFLSLPHSLPLFFSPPFYNKSLRLFEKSSFG